MDSIDIRAKLIAGVLLIFCVVLQSPMSLVEFLVLCSALCAVAYLLESPIGKILKLSAISLPFAGTVAAFAPLALLTSWSPDGVAAAYSTGWPLIAEIVSKAYVSALVVSVITESTTPTVLFAGLGALRMPRIFLTIFTFLYRFTDLFREQIVIMRNAIASRAPGLTGLRLAMLYGRLGGNLFVRAYERGEQIHDAMCSRGYNGTLPSRSALSWRTTDTAIVFFTLLTCLAIVLY